MLKIGVLGAGHLGKIHLKLIQELNDIYELTGLYDPDEQRANEVSSELQVKSFNSIDELIDAVDVVDIVTPTLSHYECAVKAIRNFKHAFIEKPLTNTLDEAKRLVGLTEEAGIKIQVGHVERFNPAFVAAKPYLQNPMFIEAHRLAPFNPRGTDVSVVLDLMIHDIDIVLHLVKSDVKKISASGVPVVSTSADICNARLEFNNGCVANLTASRISMKKMRKMRLFQKEGYCTIDFGDKKAEIFEIHDVEEQTENEMTIEVGIDQHKKALTYKCPEIPELNAIKEELKTFNDAVINDKTPEVTVGDGYTAMLVAQEILRKIEKSVLI